MVFFLRLDFLDPTFLDLFELRALFAAALSLETGRYGMRADGEIFWVPEYPETLSEMRPLMILGFPFVVLLLVDRDLFLGGIEVDAVISCALSLVSNLTSGFLPIDIGSIDLVRCLHFCGSYQTDGVVTRSLCFYTFLPTISPFA